MIKVKFTPYRKELGKIYFRQTKEHNMMSLDGRYKFYIDEEIENPDFWVVQGKGIRTPETHHVAPENTIFFTTEPKSVLIYPDKYLRQFGTICTCQEETKPSRIPNSKVLFTPPLLPWFIGCKEDENEVVTFSYDYDKFKSEMPQKTKLISVISSDKAFTQGHIDRLRFVEKLKEHFGDDLDVFGRGSNPFDDKWDVIAPYKYHIVIENSTQKYYWTEKLGDCYLGGAFPFYHGCTNLSEYFPEKGFEAIDIRCPEKAIEIIEKEIKAERFESSQAVLAECKNKVLDEYNLFEYIAKICDELDCCKPKTDVTIEPCHSSSNITNLWRYTIGRKYYSLKAKKWKK